MRDISYYEENRIDAEMGEFQRRLLIIMPVYDEFELIVPHLDALEKQNMKIFDVAVVLTPGKKADFNLAEKIAEKKYSFALCLIERANDTGCAGGFFVGEKYALANGYEAAIYADVDASIEERDLIKKLWDAYKAGNGNCIMPAADFYEGEETLDVGTNIHLYGLVSVSLMKRIGLHYAPIDFGDDAEYTKRIVALEKPVLVDARVKHLTHAYTHIAKNFDRMAKVTTNVMLFFAGRSPPVQYLYTFSLQIPIFLIFGEKYIRDNALFIINSMLSHSYGTDLKSFRTNWEDYLSGFKPGDFEVAIGALKNFGAKVAAASYLYYPSPLINGSNHPYLMAKSIMAGFRKKFLLVRVVKLPFFMVLSRECYLYEKDSRALRLSNNSNRFLHLLKLVILLPAIAIFIPLAILLYIISAFRLPRTKGYGTVATYK